LPENFRHQKRNFIFSTTCTSTWKQKTIETECFRAFYFSTEKSVFLLFCLCVYCAEKQQPRKTSKVIKRQRVKKNFCRYCCIVHSSSLRVFSLAFLFTSAAFEILWFYAHSEQNSQKTSIKFWKRKNHPGEKRKPGEIFRSIDDDVDSENEGKFCPL
jgi:hypothetical protein